MDTRRLFLFLLLLLHLQAIKAAIETSEKITIEVGKNYKLELPDPARGYIDETRWANNTTKVKFISSVDNDEALVWIVANQYFEGEATVECLYTCAWYDENIGGTRADTYLRTFYIKCKAQNKERLNVNINPYGGAVKAGSNIELEATVSSKKVDDALIFYTTDGTEPSNKSTRYWSPIVINNSMTLKVIAYHDNYLTSNVKSAVFSVGDHYDGEKIIAKTEEGIDMSFFFTKYLSSYYLSVGTGSDSPAIDKEYTGKITVPQKVGEYEVKVIGGNAFHKCNLSSIFLPYSISNIGSYSFAGCKNLKSIKLPPKVQSIGTYAFGGSLIEFINIPEGVTSIGQSAFFYCDNLKEIRIPSTISSVIGSIGDNAFECCYGLKNIYSYIVNPPNIDNDVFKGEYNTAILYVPNGTIKNYQSKSGWKNFGTIKEIGEADDIKVTSITIGTPSSMTVGNTQQLTATVSPDNATNKTVKWSSANASVVSVDENTGLVTAKSAGTATITCAATDGSGVTATCSITVNAAPKPKLILSASPSGGSVESGTKVYLTASANGSTVSGADIYYTANGSTPSKSSTKYTSSGITINSATTIKAIAYKDGYDTSDVGSWSYTIATKPKLVISASPTSGNVESGTIVYLTASADGSSIAGADIYYTTNGSTPSENSTKYTSSGITITQNCTLKAIAYKEGYETSEVLIGEFRIEETIASKTIVSISAGEGASSFITDDGELWTSGYTPACPFYDYDDIFIDSKDPIKTMENVKFCIASYSRSLILLNDNRLLFCGSPLGPQKLSLVTEDVVSIALGSSHGLYAKSDGTMFAFGFNDHGQYGCGTTEQKMYPQDAIKVMDGVECVFAGGSSSYILKKDGTLWACGGNKGGQFGDGTTTERLSPVYIMSNVKKVAAGWYHILILKNDDTLWGCGSNSYYGQLGNGTGKDEYSSILIANNVSDISANISSSFMVKKDGSLWACGDNEFGQLGDGSTTIRKVFTKIMDGVSKVSAGEFYTIILKKDGTVWTCGRNQYGQLGDGTMTDRITPVCINKKTNTNEESINISEMGYATFFDSQSAYALPNGLSAQVVTNAGNNRLTYKTIADGSVSGVVPAGTAVMLVCDSKKSGTYTLEATESSASYSGANLLRGSDEAQMTTGDGYHYKLSYGQTGTSWSDVFGWYWGADNGGSFMAEGHKAWLVVPKSVATTRGFTVDGETTGIATIEQIEKEPVYYDLQGRRISKPIVKGVYIKNGKKVMVK